MTNIYVFVVCLWTTSPYRWKDYTRRVIRVGKRLSSYRETNLVKGSLLYSTPSCSVRVHLILLEVLYQVLKDRKYTFSAISVQFGSCRNWKIIHCSSTCISTLCLWTTNYGSSRFFKWWMINTTTISYLLWRLALSPFFNEFYFG